MLTFVCRQVANLSTFDNLLLFGPLNTIVHILRFSPPSLVSFFLFEYAIECVAGSIVSSSYYACLFWVVVRFLHFVCSSDAKANESDRKNVAKN